jgi:allophanate hydrolase
VTGPLRRAAERIGATGSDAGSLGEVVAVAVADGAVSGTARRAVADAFAAIADDGQPGIWITLVDRGDADHAADEVDRRAAAGEPVPLAGRTFAVKGNIDVAGVRTTAGCATYGSVPDQHAPVVQQLVDAGAVVVGVTNLDQFATGLVGTRSPFGICPNAHWDGLVSGGSSSGSAVAVARGHVDFSIGTDTAGSGRVPAAANGILGWKPTKSRVSTDGVVPACESLDCVSFFGRRSEVLEQVCDVVAPRVAPDESDAASAPDHAGPIRLGVAAAGSLVFDGDEGWGSATTAAIDTVVDQLGAVRVDVDIDPFLATGRLLYEGAFVRERFDAVGEFIERHRDDVDLVVYSIIHAAGALAPEDLERDRQVVAERELALRPVWDDLDALVLPTVPRVPTVAEVRAEPIAVNSMLGTYTNFVNLLGLCALTVPVGAPRPGGPPASITLIAPAGRDEPLLPLAAELGRHPLAVDRAR